MSLEWYCPTHELVLKTLGARVSTQVANLIMPVLSRRASSTSATVTIAHKHQLSINERRMICHLLVDDI
ncbi:hypothetical protein [Enterococcus gallinarum]|uniref:hypothetical protein n=1 Tax=Enterococcus gallinarum TaxID=1353 RepID=UPI0018AB7E5C|nr:hypothetical protein [Enterococcus gallinarum]